MFSKRDLDRLDADLAATFRDYAKEARAVVARGALNIKNDARDRAPHGPHTPAYAASITYDLGDTVSEIRAAIGPDKNRPQGPLGNIFELGSPGRPPQPHLMPALDAEEPRFREHIADLGERLLKDHLR